MFHLNVQEILNLTNSKKLNFSINLKNEGVELYKEEDISNAFKKFSLSIKYLILMDDEDFEDEDSKNNKEDILKEKNKLLVNLYNNLAGCHLKKQNWESAIDLCNLAIKNDPNNIKAYFRKGSSYMEMQEFEKALEDFEKALELEPTNKAIINKIQILKEKAKNYEKNCASAMKKMFQ